MEFLALSVDVWMTHADAPLWGLDARGRFLVRASEQGPRDGRRGGFGARPAGPAALTDLPNRMERVPSMAPPGLRDGNAPSTNGMATGPVPLPMRTPTPAWLVVALFLVMALGGCFGKAPGDTGTVRENEEPPKELVGDPEDPDEPPLRLLSVFAGGAQPVMLTHAGDGSGRVFLVDQDGTVFVGTSAAGDDSDAGAMAAGGSDAGGLEDGGSDAGGMEGGGSGRIAAEGDDADAGTLGAAGSEDRVVDRYGLQIEGATSGDARHAIDWDDVPYLDIDDRVQSGGERGLFALAFDPDFATTGRLYVHYSGSDGETVLSRFTVETPQDVTARPSVASEEVLLTVDQPFSNHNGGGLAFGPDGYLYLALGDGGGAGDPLGHGQNKATLLGSVLRLDVSSSGTDAGYGVPQDNPFVGGVGRDELWVYGLRNPWRISFDRESGDLWLGDVGQDTMEEVDRVEAGSGGGQNMGWNDWEGTRKFKPLASDEGMTFPVAEYVLSSGRCAVSGGYVYRGAGIPALVGTYLFGDYCSGEIWGLQRGDGDGGSGSGDAAGGSDASATATGEGDHTGWKFFELFATEYNVSGFGEDEAGEVYVMDLGGRVLKIVR